MSSGVTYIFQNGKVYVVREGKVIGAATEVNDELEKLSWDGPDPGYSHHPENMQMGGPTKMPPPPEQTELDTAPGAGQGFISRDGAYLCPDCAQADPDADPYDGPPEECSNCGRVPGEKMGPGASPLDSPAPHDDPGFPHGTQYPGTGSGSLASITTPNGLKGTVLGKVAGLWGDEVTVRLENGRIVRLPVSKEMKFASTKVAKEEGSPIDRLEARLASSIDGTRGSLVARRDALVAIQHEARSLIANGVSHKDSEELDQIIVTAELEMAEVDLGLDHFDDEATQAYQPPAPFSMGVADEAAVSMGGSNASWLDETVNDMIADAEATDFQKLMDEGPEAYAAELPDAAIADQGVVHQMASNFIRTKTAGVDPQVRDPYEKTFLSRVEQRRRAELANRKKANRKEAATEENRYDDLPDDAFFL